MRIAGHHIEHSLQHPVLDWHQAKSKPCTCHPSGIFTAYLAASYHSFKAQCPFQLHPINCCASQVRSGDQHQSKLNYNITIHPEVERGLESRYREDEAVP